MTILTRARQAAEIMMGPARGFLKGMPGRHLGYRFNIDRQNSDRVQGWVFHTLSPLDRVEITVRTERQILVRSVADHFRADVRQLGHADGRCGFDLRLPRLKPGTRFAVYAGDVELCACGPRAPRKRGKVIIAGRTRLVVDQPLQPTKLSGWVSDLDETTLRIPLLLRGVELSLHARATLFRSDAEGDGFHGFRFPTLLQPGRYGLERCDTGQALYTVNIANAYRAGR